MRFQVRAAIVMTIACFTTGASMAADNPGVTPTEIKIGGIFPISGPASAIGIVGKGILAYTQMINAKGGINGRKINYIAMDDAYSPPKAVEHARRLVESDEIAFMYGQLGTASNTATAKYLKTKGIPSIGIVSGSSKFTDAKEFPLVTTGLVSYDTEGKIYAKYLNSVLPNAKIAILFQNDDLGKDYVNAFRATLKEDFDRRVVTASYETSEPTVDSQVVNLKSSGAEALFVAGTPKFAAQAIRKASEIGWKAKIIINYPSSSIGGTLQPAGLENSIGVIAGSFAKDVTDSKLADDPSVQAYKEFFAKYVPGGDFQNTSYATGYMLGAVLEQILKQCGDDLSRKNIVLKARSIKSLEVPLTKSGVLVNTSATNNMFWTQMQLQRWSGSNWEPVGQVIDARAD